VYALETVFDILMDNCVDLNTPITYQFFYYDSQSALDFETQNPLKVQRKQLNDRGASKKISSVLPAGNIVLIAQAIDSREAIANITLTKNLNT
jgi:proprotein convertase subtilisin/kexin type 5